MAPGVEEGEWLMMNDYLFAEKLEIIWYLQLIFLYLQSNCETK